MSPLSVAIQTSQTQVSQSSNKSQFSRNHGLTAKWSLEAGKLICYWSPVQSGSSH